MLSFSQAIMHAFKRSLPFLVLNVFISAVTTLVVLALWSMAHPQAVAPVSSGIPATQAVNLNQCITYTPASGEHPLTITSVIGGGNVQWEEVDIQFTGSGSLCLNGWKLGNDKGMTYSFPNHFQLLASGVVIKVYSRGGIDTPLELYWGSSDSIWQSGTIAHLYDPQGNEQAVFKIP